VSIDSRELRDALGLFATGVCLVTLTDADGEPHGLTVNSFASVSLDPPLILWSLQKDSEVYAMYAGAERFAVAVLADQQQNHASDYAKKGAHRLADAHHRRGTNGAPLIRDALVNFECSLEHALDGGDHTILLGRVTDIVAGEAGAPLLFYGGRFGAMQ